KACELGTRLVTMPLGSRVDLFCSWRLWRFCRRNRIDLLKTYSSKDHWLCLPLYFCGIPLSRARCITDPIGSKGRAFVFKHGCSNIVADASVIKRQLVLVEGAPLVLAERSDARFVVVGQGTGILKRGINVRNAIDRAGLADK